jgi:N-hydroxyarylamine O-acetyltransferase
MAEGQPWLVDVGFGAFTHHPLRWEAGVDQDDPAGTYRLEQEANGDVVARQVDRPVYRVEPRPRALVEFVPTCWWQQTSPESHFTQASICSILTEDGRVTVRDRTLIETKAGTRSERVVDDDGELLALYRDRFGVVLAEIPDVSRHGRLGRG